MTDRVKELEYEVEALKRQVAEMSSLFNHARAAGLDDLIAGHGFQRFVADGKARIDTTGIQMIPGDTAMDPANGTAYIASAPAYRFTDAFFLKRDEEGGSNPYRPQAWLQASLTTTDILSLFMGAQNIWASGRGFVGVVVDDSNSGIGTTTKAYMVASSWDALDPLTYSPAGIAVTAAYTGTFDVAITGQLLLESRTANPTYTVTDGSMHYRTNTDKFRGRANGAWENFAMESYVDTQDRLYDETFAFFMGGA